jgi:hypothetical protein
VREQLVSHHVRSPAEIVGLVTELTLEQKVAQLSVFGTDRDGDRKADL